MSTALTLLLLVCVGGFAFFAIRWVQLRTGYRAMTDVEKTYANVTMDTERAAAKRQSKIKKIRNKMEATGLGRSLFPLIALLVFAYMAMSILLRLTGLSDLYSALAAGPLAILTGWILYRYSQRKKVDRFNNQMIILLELLTAQVKAGNGVERSLVTVTPALPQPIRGELETAIAAGSTGGDLLESLRELSERYPSRAFSMFLAALEIDKSEGHSITPALIQAADLLKRSFALQSEARAELSSTRMEFFGVSAILFAITIKLVVGSSNPIYFKPLGIAFLLIGFANAGLGVWRFNRLISKMRKDTQ